MDFDSSGLDQAYAEQARATISDVISSPKGWRQAGINYAITNQSADVTFHFASADKLASLHYCSPKYSCRVGKDIYINSDRWRYGSPSLSMPIEEYRAMIINHELGHTLGFDEWQCYGHSVRAPVMQQQSINLGGLIPNAWPTKEEIRRLIKN